MKKYNSKNLFIYIMKAFGEYITMEELKQMQKILFSQYHNEHDKIIELEYFELQYHKIKHKALEEQFIQMLDSQDEPIALGGVLYPYSYVYESIDSVSYEIEKNDYITNIMESYEN